MHRIIAALAVLAMTMPADADRYAPQMAQGASSGDVTRAVREQRKAIPRAGKRQHVPIPRPRPQAGG